MGKIKESELIELINEVRDLETELNEKQMGDYLQYKTEMLSIIGGCKEYRGDLLRANREAYRDLRLYLYDTLNKEMPDD